MNSTIHAQRIRKVTTTVSMSEVSSVAPYRALGVAPVQPETGEILIAHWGRNAGNAPLPTADIVSQGNNYVSVVSYDTTQTVYVTLVYLKI